MNCRYCDKPVPEREATATNSYWQGLRLVCHKGCKEEGLKQEAFDCQVIDADCNDCRYFKRGKLAVKTTSTYFDNRKKRMVTVVHQPNVFGGHCLKFDRATVAQPNKWSGLECFEHRRSIPLTN